jgi:hypothetical protein
VAQNLIRNGGFEGPAAGDAPQGWSFHDFRQDELTGGEVVRKNAAFGKHCLKLQAPAFPADFAAFCLPIDVEGLESDEILFSCFYRTEEHPQALVTLAAYGQNFAEREFQTPELHSESHPIGETSKWDVFTTRMAVPQGARQVVVFLRIMGGGSVFWDGVSLRPVGGEVEVDLQQAGIIEQMPNRRGVLCRVRNVSDREMRLRLEIEATEEDKKRVRRGHDDVSLTPGEEGQLQISYKYDFDAPHRLRMVLEGNEPEDIHGLWRLDVPGLVDARIVEPAFRSTILSSVPTAHVTVEGRLNAVPEIARTAQVEAMIVGTGERAGELEPLTDEGLAGPWRLEMPADGMLTQQYIVNVTATVDRKEQTVGLPVTRAPHAEAETAYDSGRHLWINGAPVFPIGIYRVAQEKDLPVVSEGGFNFVITPSRMLSFRYADAARDAGIHVILSSDTLDGQFWEYMAGKYYNHEAMIGWNGIDLPDTKLVTYHNLSQAYRKADQGPYPAIAQADPHHPIVLALRPNSTLERYAELADIVMAYSEPVPRSPLTAVADAVQAAREAVGETKPVWAIIQSTGYRWISELSPTPRPDGRPPTAAEHRAMVYLALMAGADGVVSHAWGLPAIGGRGSYYIPRDQPGLWAGMVETNRQLDWLAPALLANAPQAVELPWDSPVQMATWDRGDSRVVVAVNTADTTAAIGFDVGARAGQEVALPFEDRCIVANEDGEIGDIFEPYATHIYQVSD